MYTHVKSAAKPAPTPELFVGVLTETKMRSASMMALSTSVEKKRFLPLCCLTISSRPGSKMGRSSEFQAAIRWGLTSTIVTWLQGRQRASKGQHCIPSHWLQSIKDQVRTQIAALLACTRAMVDGRVHASSRGGLTYPGTSLR